MIVALREKGKEGAYDKLCLAMMVWPFIRYLLYFFLTGLSKFSSHDQILSLSSQDE